MMDHGSLFHFSEFFPIAEYDQSVKFSRKVNNEVAKIIDYVALVYLIIKFEYVSLMLT